MLFPPVEAAEAAAEGYGDELDDAEREAVWLAGWDRDVHWPGDRGRAGAVPR